MKVKDLDTAQANVLITDNLNDKVSGELDALLERHGKEDDLSFIKTLRLVYDDLSEPIAKMFAIRNGLNEIFDEDVTDDILSTIIKIYSEYVDFLESEVEV